jgi:outer membrane protein OmpA-like peptidoglycan-associated protein
MTKAIRLSVPALALVLAACGGSPRPIHEAPPPGSTTETIVVPSEGRFSRHPVPVPPAHGAAPAALIAPGLAGPLTVARVEPYMDALETDLRRHVHARGLVTQRRGNEINIVIANDLLFTPDGGVAGDEVLEPLASILRGYAHTAVAVGGYTDTAGTPQQNLAVSQKRARQIADALVHEGVPGGRIGAQGYGETHLRIATGDHKSEPRNRRIEILIKPAPG